MAEIKLKTTRHVVPMIYAYTTPEIRRHDGWTKIGYTEQDVEKRLDQQTHTADVEYHEEWRGNAVYDDGSGETFKDTDFHAYLKKNEVERQSRTEWFKITGVESKNMFNDFRSNRGSIKDAVLAIPYKLRDEQEEAISKTVDYFRTHENGEFLWNCKPRFGKTLSVYDFVKRIDAEKILIVTNRPAIANSWYDDFVKFAGFKDIYYFATNTFALRGKLYSVSSDSALLSKTTSYIEFESLQDIKGSIYLGGKFDKYKKLVDTEWDVLVIDEAHEGVDTYKTDVAFDHIKRKFTLHLSGTPFKALANDKFPDDAIFNWTYADEQKAKETWDTLHPGETNPYASLPRLNMFTYKMSDIIKDELKQGIKINGETEEYAFDLNEFFSVDSLGRFKHDNSVDMFIDALTTQEKFPFSTEELREEIKHSFWLLDRVDSARALAKKLENHPVFSQYKIILAAGDGKLNEDERVLASFSKVALAIEQYDKTITLSVGQLTTGVTVPEWTAVLILSNVSSPALYMQAAFRSQNPCLFSNHGLFYRKQNAYVFDFDPARTLTIFEQFANDLASDTSDGRGSLQQRKDNIRNLLNFFPVIGEDENGKMVELDSTKVLSIPRKIKSTEVVRSGFMSNFLFQNISQIFNAPKEVIDIVKKFTPTAEPQTKFEITNETAKNLSLNSKGEVEIPYEKVIGLTQDVFGSKIFDDITDNLNNKVEELQYTYQENKKDPMEEIKEAFKTQAIDVLITTAQESYGSNLKHSEKNRLERKLKNDTEKIVDKSYGDYEIQKRLLEKEYQEKLATAQEGEEEQVIHDFEQKQKMAVESLKRSLTESVDSFAKSAGEDIVRTIETSKKQAERNEIEDKVRNHLRGFSRTIPSFLMAYGDDKITLETFDQIAPDQVFIDVTSITLEQFRFLRDGGSYIDEESGEVKIFDGHLFDSVVFNDSVKEFLNLKKRLSDYFDDSNTEDIFDYIPPQTTFQIFTPKKIVKQMADLLEEENPGCYDDPNKTFIDLYMKSGLYIAEIVKRLYNSKKIQELYPDKLERLNHIFSNQVYGLAPTEIIYRIVLAYVLGFSEKIKIKNNNLCMADATPYVKEGKLEELLVGLYPEFKDDCRKV
jgi:hypothetical protein